MRSERSCQPHTEARRARAVRENAGGVAGVEPGPAFSVTTLSRQRKWQLARLAKGLCEICGNEPLLTKRRCKTHALAMRRHSRKKYGYKAWRPGSCGLPPTELR